MKLKPYLPLLCAGLMLLLMGAAALDKYTIEVNSTGAIRPPFSNSFWSANVTRASNQWSTTFTPSNSFYLLSAGVNTESNRINALVTADTLLATKAALNTESNRITTVADHSIAVSNFTFAVSNLVYVQTAGQVVLSNGVTVVSNGLTTLSNSLAGLYQPLDAQLTDVANMTMTGNAGKVPTVNAGGTALELQTPSAGGTSYVDKSLAQGRLTPVSGQAIVTTNATNTSLYYTPHQGNGISLYSGSGSTWTNATLTELTIPIPATVNTVYDVFIYDTGAYLTNDLTAWTDTSTRATALVQQDGIWVKSGATTRKFVGTFMTGGTSGSTHLRFGGTADGGSFAAILIWNHYHQETAQIAVHDSTDSWTYNSTTFRSVNASTNNRITFVNGLTTYVSATQKSTSSGTAGLIIGIGVNSTSTYGGALGRSSTIANASQATAFYSAGTAVGLNFLQALERTAAAGTATISGDNGSGSQEQGLFATLKY